MDLARIRKALVAGLGLAVILAPRLAGVEGDAVAIFDAVVAILTTLGVYRVPNAAAPHRRADDVDL